MAVYIPYFIQSMPSLGQRYTRRFYLRGPNLQQRYAFQDVFFPGAQPGLPQRSALPVRFDSGGPDPPKNTEHWTLALRARCCRARVLLRDGELG